MSSDHARTAVAGDGSERHEPASREVGRAIAFVLRSTRARPQTEAEVAAKLRTRGFLEDVVTAAVAQAKALGAVDDEAFAAAWVEDRGRRRGYAPARLREELRRRQVPEWVTEGALSSLDDHDTLAAATELARRRAQRLPGSLPPETAARRVLGYLLRRGYPHALARRATITATGLDRSWD